MWGGSLGLNLTLTYINIYLIILCYLETFLKKNSSPMQNMKENKSI